MRGKMRGSHKRIIARAAGMTLIEIMVVVAIIGMLMGSVGVMAMKKLAEARVSDTKMIIKNVEQAVGHFQIQNTDTCPKSINDLWTQKILDKEPKDAWGESLIFKCPGEHNTDGADIISKGKDKQEGTVDDIKSWEL